MRPVLSGPATARRLRRPEVDGVGRAANLQFLPQCFGRRVEPAPNGPWSSRRLRAPASPLVQGLRAGCTPCIPAQRRALAGCTVRARFVQRRRVSNVGIPLPPRTSGRQRGHRAPLPQPAPMIETRTARSGWRRRLLPGRPRRPAERSTILAGLLQIPRPEALAEQPT